MADDAPFTIDTARTYQSFYKTEGRALVNKYGVEVALGVLAHKIDRLEAELLAEQLENARLKQQLDAADRDYDS
jgi:hypothetical protein